MAPNAADEKSAVIQKTNPLLLRCHFSLAVFKTVFSFQIFDHRCTLAQISLALSFLESTWLPESVSLHKLLPNLGFFFPATIYWIVLQSCPLPLLPAFWWYACWIIYIFPQVPEALFICLVCFGLFSQMLRLHNLFWSIIMFMDSFLCPF